MEKRTKKDSPKLWQAWKQIKARNWNKPLTVQSFLQMSFLGTCSKVTYSTLTGRSTQGSYSGTLH